MIGLVSACHSNEQLMLYCAQAKIARSTKPDFCPTSVHRIRCLPSVTCSISPFQSSRDQRSIIKFYSKKKTDATTSCRIADNQFVRTVFGYRDRPVLDVLALQRFKLLVRQEDFRASTIISSRTSTIVTELLLKTWAMQRPGLPQATTQGHHWTPGGLRLRTVQPIRTFKNCQFNGMYQIDKGRYHELFFLDPARGFFFFLNLIFVQKGPIMTENQTTKNTLINIVKAFGLKETRLNVSCCLLLVSIMIHTSYIQYSE